MEGSRIAQSSCTASTGSSCHLVTDFSTERQNLLYLDVDVTLWGFEKKHDAKNNMTGCIDVMCNLNHRTGTEGRPFRKEDNQDSRCPT